MIECVKSGLRSFVPEIFLLDNAPQWDRPVEVDDGQTKTLTENNQCSTVQGRANIPEISKSSTENHSCQLGYVNLFDVWVPHKLSKNNFLDLISTCNSLLNVMKMFHFKNIL